MGRETSLPSRLLILARRFLHRAEVDRAVAVSLLARLWSLAAGPVTLVMIASYLSAELQGYYYTFASLLALQSFVELGFSIVLAQFASHEWAHLRFDAVGAISGDPRALSRLGSLATFVVRWYAVAGGIFAVAVGTGGYAFLSLKAAPEINWWAPWVAFVATAGLQLWLIPFIVLLEGCNQVASVNTFRLAQGIASSVTLWIGLLLDKGLWVAPLSLGAGVLCSGVFLMWSYGGFFLQVFRAPAVHSFCWRSEIWPMQWRFACNGLASYFAFSLFTPVTYWAYGAVEAGKMGMTLSVIGGLQSMAAVWLMTRVPRFGVLIALRKYDELDALYKRILAFSLGVIVTGCAIVWAIVLALNYGGSAFAGRLLPPLPFAVFLCAAVLQHVALCQGYYLVAHKKNPLLAVGVTTSVMIGCLVYILGSRYGPLGAGFGNLLVVAAILIPWQTLVWFRCRNEWHVKEVACGN